MQYVIATSHKGKDDTVTKAMPYLEARGLFMSLTDQHLPRTEVQGAEMTIDRTTIREASLPELCEVDEDGCLNIDGIVENFSTDRIQVAYERAIKELGLDEPEDDDEDFVDAFHDQLIKMAASDFIHYCEQEKIIQADGVDEEGTVCYSKVPNS